MGAETATEMARLLVSLPIELADPVRDLSDVMQLTLHFNLSAYDAAYLQLAISADAPLVTLDGSLVAADEGLLTDATLS